MPRAEEKTVLLERGGVIFELHISGEPNDMVLEEVVNTASEKNIDADDFEQTLTHDEWTIIGEQYGRSDR